MFITFEGGDKAGKTTQIALLKERLEREGKEVLVTREPGGTPLSERIRELVLSPEYFVEPLTEALLYAAARAQHVREVIRPALLENKIVICDRFFDSSIAYQAFGRDLGVKLVQDLNREAMNGVHPDRTYLLSLPVDQAEARRTDVPDRLEAAGNSFHARVRDGYMYVHSNARGRVFEIDASMSVQEISDLIWRDLSAIMI